MDLHAFIFKKDEILRFNNVLKSFQSYLILFLFFSCDCNPWTTPDAYAITLVTSTFIDTQYLPEFNLKYYHWINITIAKDKIV